MKKKVMLGIIAASMSAILAIGGTLMLFTAQSETATNIVTVPKGIGDEDEDGNFGFALQETDETKGKDVYQDVGEEYDDPDHFTNGTYNDKDEFTGLDYIKKAYPKSEFVKRPRVIRRDIDGADAWLRVKATLIIEAPKLDTNGDIVVDANGDIVYEEKNWTTLSADEKEILLEIWYRSTHATMTGVDPSRTDLPEWYVDDPNIAIPKLLAQATAPVWYYYYVDDNGVNPKQLKTYTAPDGNPAVDNPTSDIYKAVTVPNFSNDQRTPAAGGPTQAEIDHNKALYDAFMAMGASGWKLGVKLTAQAVQVENNGTGQGVDEAALAAYFNDYAFAN